MVGHGMDIGPKRLDLPTREDENNWQVLIET